MHTPSLLTHTRVRKRHATRGALLTPTTLGFDPPLPPLPHGMANNLVGFVAVVFVVVVGSPTLCGTWFLGAVHTTRALLCCAFLLVYC